MGSRWPCFINDCVAPEWQPEDSCVQFWNSFDRCAVETLNYASFIEFTTSISTVLRRHLKISTAINATRNFIGVCWRPHLLVSVAVHSVILSDAVFYPVIYECFSDMWIFKEQLAGMICLCPPSLLPAIPKDYTIYSDKGAVFQRTDWCLLLRSETSDQPFIPAVPNRSYSDPNTRLAYVISTSGSSGGPKKFVFVADSCLTANIVDLCRRFPVKSHYPPHKNSVLLTAPLTFDPSLVQIYFALISHRCLVIPEATMLGQPGSLLLLCRHAHVNWLQCTPSLFMLQCHADRENFLSRTGMSILLGGEPFPSNILQRILRPHRAAVYSIYGVTEVSSWASLCRLGKVGDESARCDCLPPVTSCTPIGFPMLATRLNLLKSKDRLESVLTVTRELGGYVVMRQTSPVVVDSDLQHVLASLPNVEPWRTADLVMAGECGRCLWFVGREDRTVKRFGYQINLERLEDCIVKCKLPRRLEIRFCICDLKVQCETQKLVAKIGVVPRPGGTMTTCLTNHYRNRLQSHISTYLRRNFGPTFEPWMPSRFIFYEGNPEVSAHGKIVRKLRAKKARPLIHRAAYFAKLWCEESGCNVEIISPHQTFFSIGGSSLGALHLVEVLVQRFPRLVMLRNDLIRHIFSSNFGNFVQFLCDTSKYPLNNLSQNSSLFVQSERVHQRALSVETLQPNIKREIFTKGSTIYSSIDSLEGSYLEVAWRFPLGKCVDASALVLCPGTSSSEPPLVFIGSHSGQFSSLQLDTGEPFWHCSSEAIGGRIEAAATYGYFSSAFVSVGTLNGRLNTIDLMTGNKLWHFDTGGPIKTAPTFSFDLGLLVLGSHGRVVHAIDPRTPQKPAWINRFDNSPIVSSITQFSSRQFIVASLGGSVGCIDCRNPQKTVWLHSGLPPVFTSPIQLTDTNGRDLTIVICVDGNICSYCTLSGGIAWRSSLSCVDRKCTIFSDPVLRSPESDLLISSSGGTLFSFDTKTARLLWEMNCLADLFPGDPAQLGTTSILRTSYESILVLSRADGRILLCPHPKSIETPLSTPLPMLPVASYQLPNVSFSSPVLCEDVRSNKMWLLVGCRDDNVYGMTLCVR
ncbi:hypothetical protein EG68_12051 [Paragonimus skrjabini miyazakii]|uniref:Acyl-CoA synthetase family member 4 n=1 Tax=Paragonimus skrjabini miyazakii TaxID=59628 RepID=A0A8S9YBE3_9TREM|nr:hypothetical protein EG68_12051 [Paragonimus skrjabini miyazakii]